MRTLYNVYDIKAQLEVLTNVDWDDIDDVYRDDDNFDINPSEMVMDYYGNFIHRDDAIIGNDDGEIYHIDEAQYCDVLECYFSPDESFYPYRNNEQISQTAINRGSYYCCYELDSYWDEDEAIYCEDIGDYVYCELAHWSDADECYYYDEELASQSRKSIINGYHNSPDIEDLNNGKSKFSIGFEIEKRSFNGLSCRGDFIGDFELFKGFETDSSCGVEAITNILPLSINKDIEDYVFGLFDEAKSVINSPNVDKSCGGHISISIDGLYGEDVFDKLRSSMAIIYALYRFRLKNSYCCNNGLLKKENNDKYTPVNIKRRYIEIRLPSYVRDVEQLKLRYKLLAKIVHMVVDKGAIFRTVLRACKPILEDMYKDKIKADEICALAVDFWYYLTQEQMSIEIQKYLKTNNN